MIICSDVRYLNVQYCSCSFSFVFCSDVSKSVSYVFIELASGLWGREHAFVNLSIIAQSLEHVNSEMLRRLQRVRGTGDVHLSVNNVYLNSVLSDIIFQVARTRISSLTLT